MRTVLQGCAAIKLRFEDAKQDAKLPGGSQRMSHLQDCARITPFLWFDKNAEEAADFYISVFKNSRRIGELRNPGPAPGGAGSILTITFELDGVRFIALNGGPDFKFNQSVSFVVRCDSQAEIDYYWERLTEGGSEVACGWLTDKFGLSWQVTPANIDVLVGNRKGMEAMMTMKKLDIAALEAAARS
jgi:predicted 3-demethylubiquinone-9 3-methyltransferase (glyoxalase superfamily)